MIKHLKASILFFTLLIFFFSVGAFAQQETQEFALPPMQMGETLLKMGQYDGANAIYSKLFETGAENPYIVRGLVKSHAGLKTLNTAVTTLESYLKKNPDSSAALYGLGLASYMNKEVEKAEEYLNKAIEQDSRNSPAYNTIAVLFFDKKEYSKALVQLQKAIKMNPGDLLIYRNLWRTYQALGQSETFLKEFEQAKAENSQANILGYGRAYAAHLRQEGFKAYEAGQIDKTINQMTRMLEVYREIGHVSGEVSSLFSLALLEEEKGKKEAAIGHYRALLKINPDHIQAREKIQELEQEIKNQ